MQIFYTATNIAKQLKHPTLFYVWVLGNISLQSRNHFIFEIFFGEFLSFSDVNRISQ